MTEPTEAADASLPQQKLWGLSWAHFLNDGAANFLPGVLPAILIHLDLSVALAGTIMAALLIGQGLQPFVGLVADRIGGRALILAGLFGSSLGAALVGVTDSVGLLIVVLLLIGVSNALFHPQALAGVRRLAATHQGSAMSFFLVGGEVGRGVWPVLASGVVMVWGLSALWVLALPAMFTLPFLLRWAPALPARHPDAAPIQWRRHARPLSLLVAFCALRALMIFSLVTFVPLIWARAGGSLTTGATFITVLMVVGVIGNLGGGWISDRVGSRPVLLAAMAAATALLALFVQLESAWMWIVCGALGIAVFATLPLTILIAQDILPENRSFGSGLALGLANALGAIGVMALGPVAAQFSPTAALWVAVGCGVIATMIAVVMPNHAPN